MKLATRYQTWILAAVGSLVLSAVPARASLVASVQFVNANVGSTGNSLEVTLQNTGPSAVTIAGFSFLVNTADTDITFTGADVNTAHTYIFAGDSQDVSFFGGAVNTLSAGQSMDGLDFSNNNGDVVAAGATVGLGRVLFDISPAALPGPAAVVLSTDSAHTSLSDPNGNLITIDSFNDGQITVTSAAVPEPATDLLLIGALAGIFVAKRRAA